MERSEPAGKPPEVVAGQIRKIVKRGLLLILVGLLVILVGLGYVVFG